MRDLFQPLFVCLTVSLTCVTAPAQTWDYPARLSDSIAAEGKFHPAMEWRERYEHRMGIDTNLTRTRLGLAYTPFEWLKVSGMVQDTRAPGYGTNAPLSAREGTDLQEAYVEVAPAVARGFGLSVGRKMLNYGDGRLLGLSSWANTSRTYDQARLLFRSTRVQVDLLFVSPVKLCAGEFNGPALGDHMTGLWTGFPDFYRKNLLELYFFQHVQNRPGGFTGGVKSAGTDRLAISALGFRLTGPVVAHTRYTVEAVGQDGEIGPARHRALGWAAALTRKAALGGKPLEVTADYKYASGTTNPSDPSRNGTLDQMYGTNHDRFGHEDLIGWRNIHNARGLATWQVSKALALNLMYNEFWLACRKDGLYSGSGRLLARSLSGDAGRHAGREADLFATYRYHHFQFGAGYGQWISGELLRRTGVSIASSYLYFFHSYAF
jgi:hypothetical protein